jgi:hypothetical protein
MKTPYGFECAYFFGDYYRGKHVEECRLIGRQPPPHDWKVSICKSCPVPGILRANSCMNMVLKGNVKSLVLGINKRMVVSAHCTKTGRVVDEPHVGCGECHPVPDIFTGKTH